MVQREIDWIMTPDGMQPLPEDTTGQIRFLRRHINDLENDLRKASIDSANAQACIEKQRNEIARLKGWS